MNSANMNSFHAHRKLKIASVANAGRASGTITRANVCGMVAPSIRAASSSSSGSDRK